MKVKLSKRNVLFEGKELKALIHNGEMSEANIKQFDPDITIVTKSLGEVDVANHSVIDLAGEYEVKDVLIYAIDLNGEKKLGLISLDIDDIKVVFINTKVKKLTKTILDQIGIANILIMDLSDIDTVNVSEFIDEIEPQYFIPIVSDEEKIAKLVKDIGAKMPEEVSSIKLSSSDFSDDNAPLSIINLKG